MKAWVVTANSFSYRKKGNAYGTKVLTLLSARKNAKEVGFFIEGLHNLFCLSLEEQQFAAKYNNPSVAYTFHIEGGSDVSCGHDPFFRAQLSNILDVKEEEGKSVLVWKTSDMSIIKSNVPLKIENRNGVLIEAEKQTFPCILVSKISKT